MIYHHLWPTFSDIYYLFLCVIFWDVSKADTNKNSRLASFKTSLFKEKTIMKR